MNDTAPETTGTNGTAEAAPAEPLKLPELSSKEQRRLREQARREVKAAERARLEAEAAKKAAAPAAEKGATPAAPEQTDAQLRENAGLFLRGVLFPLLSVLARPFGYRLDLGAFSEAAARDDGAAWVPVLRLYGWLRAVVTWTAVPARLIARVRELAQKRETAAGAKP